jgi:hypothetical protein
VAEPAPRRLSTDNKLTIDSIGLKFSDRTEVYPTKATADLVLLLALLTVEWQEAKELPIPR